MPVEVYLTEAEERTVDGRPVVFYGFELHVVTAEVTVQLSNRFSRWQRVHETLLESGALRKAFKGQAIPEFPSKHLFTNFRRRDKQQMRHEELQQWLEALLQNTRLRRMPELCKALGLANNETHDFVALLAADAETQETAQQSNASSLTEPSPPSARSPTRSRLATSLAHANEDTTGTRKPTRELSFSESPVPLESSSDREQDDDLEARVAAIQQEAARRMLPLASSSVAVLRRHRQQSGHSNDGPDDGQDGDRTDGQDGDRTDGQDGDRTDGDGALAQLQAVLHGVRALSEGDEPKAETETETETERQAAEETRTRCAEEPSLPAVRPGDKGDLQTLAAALNDAEQAIASSASDEDTCARLRCRWRVDTEQLGDGADTCAYMLGVTLL